MRTPTTPLTVVLLASLVVLGLAAPCSAQYGARLAYAPEPRSPEADAYRRELAAIDLESHVATALYVVGPVLAVGGLAAIAGLHSGFGCYGTCTAPSDTTETDIGTGIAATLALVGVVGFVVAIALDVDSGARRDALGPSPSLSLRLAPRAGGGTLALEGRF